MEIKTLNYSGGNWITAGETKPSLTDNVLMVRTGHWRTSGGSATITSMIIYNNEMLSAVVVGYRYCGKYQGGSQYWQYYQYNGIIWNRVSWKELDDGEKMLILDAYNDENTLNWVKIPGKLKRDYLKPRELQKLEIDEQGTIYGYKYLRVDNEKIYHSIINISNNVAWYNNELEADKIPDENNSNGIYAMKSVKNPILKDYQKSDRHLVKLALSGIVVEANEGLRAQHAQIVEVLQ